MGGAAPENEAQELHEQHKVMQKGCSRAALPPPLILSLFLVNITKCNQPVSNDVPLGRFRYPEDWLTLLQSTSSPPLCGSARSWQQVS